MPKTTIAVLIAVFLSVPIAASDRQLGSWDNLRQLGVGQALEVREIGGKIDKGSFVSFVNESVTIQAGQRNLVLPRAQILQIRLRPPHSRRNVWIAAPSAQLLVWE